MEISTEALEAVEAITGEPFSAEDARAVLALFENTPTEELKIQLSILYAGFEHGGGRDVELAERIDELGKAVTLREAMHA